MIIFKYNKKFFLTSHFILSLLLISIINLNAFAEEKTALPRIAILGLRSSPSIPEELNLEFEKMIIKGLKQYDVLPENIIHNKLQDLGLLSRFCANIECFKTVANIFNLDAIITGYIEKIDRAYSIDLKLITPENELLSKTGNKCDICTYEEVGDMLYKTASNLSAKIPKRLPASRIIVESPQGKNIFIDNIQVGEGNVSVPLFPGKHKLYLQKGKMKTNPKVINIKTNIVGKISLNSEQWQLDSKNQSNSSKIPRWVEWTTLGAGLTATVIGGILIGINEMCVNENENGDCEDKIESDIGGSVTLTSGIITTIFSTLLLLLH